MHSYGGLQAVYFISELANFLVFKTCFHKHDEFLLNVGGNRWTDAFL